MPVIIVICIKIVGSDFKMVFDFQLEDKNTVMKCEKCNYGLVKQMSTVVDRHSVIVVAVCDSCKMIYESSENLHTYKDIGFIGA